MLAISNPLNEFALAFPILECIHIIGFTFSVGTIALVDFRLLDLWMLNQTPAQLLKDTWLFTLVGISVMLLSGMLLYSSDPDMYYLNLAFLIKMVCLVAAIIFHYTIRRKTALAESPPAHGKLVATISLVLWGAVIFGGIFIAFINQGLT
jgi:hypothetical protein